MRFILENVPIHLSKPVISPVGKPIKIGPNVILLDKDLHRKTIVYRELDGSMCNPNEVLRALQVMGESKLNNEGNGVEVILKTPKNVCIRLLSPLKIPKSKNDGLLFLKKLC